MMDTQSESEKLNPDGILMLRTMSMPKDANPNGDIFGGWIMSQMDTAGAIMAYEMSRGRVVTVAVEKIVFRAPVYVGDVVCCYCRCVHIGTTSITIKLDLWARKNSSQKISRIKVTEANFTYVAVDLDGKKRRLPDDIINNKDAIVAKGWID